MEHSSQAEELSYPRFSAEMGVAQCDITPPLGIYARMWGKAEHDVAEGVHRPLKATACVFAPAEGGPLVVLGLDLGWWRSQADERRLRGALIDRLGLSEQQLLINLSHTHAGPSISTDAARKPGGQFIQPYLDGLSETLASLVEEAIGKKSRRCSPGRTGSVGWPPAATK